MSTSKSRLIMQCAAVTAALSLGGTAQAVDLRDWGRKLISSERFVVLAQFDNHAVLDKETQLVWALQPATLASVWSLATKACANVVIGGRKGWRLAYFQELTSLVDPTVPTGSIALPAGHPFTGVLAGFYWTATLAYEGFSSTPYAAKVNLGDKGTLSFNPIATTGYTWCVRGGASTTQY